MDLAALIAAPAMSLEEVLALGKCKPSCLMYEKISAFGFVVRDPALLDPVGVQQHVQKVLITMSPFSPMPRPVRSPSGLAVDLGQFVPCVGAGHRHLIFPFEIPPVRVDA